MYTTESSTDNLQIDEALVDIIYVTAHYTSNSPVQSHSI